MDSIPIMGGRIIAEFYKFEIGNWNEGTANLTLEQEAAYLRVVNAIRLADQPIAFSKFALCGMWRCNERKAKRLLDELVEAGKLSIEGGLIINRKAADDASNLRRLRTDRASAGHRGGVESGKSRAKALKNNDAGEASASTREEEKNRRIEEEKKKSSEPIGSAVFAVDDDFAKQVFDRAVAFLARHGTREAQARSFVGKLRKDHTDTDIFAAFSECNKAGAVDPIPWITAKLHKPDPPARIRAQLPKERQ